MGQIDYGAIFLMAITIFVFMIPLFILFPPIPVDHRDALRQTHSRLGVPPQGSNLRKARDGKGPLQSGKCPRIESLFIYPLKSCRGIELTRSKVLPSGLEYDRLYTFAQVIPRAPGSDLAKQSSKWEFLTLRQLPNLANVKVEVWLPDAAKKSRLLGSVEDKFIVVRFPWQNKGLSGLVQLLVAKLGRGLKAVPEKEFVLPLEFPSERDIESRGYKFENVKIWVDDTRALNMSRDMPAELASYLGAKNEIALFRADPSNQRQVFRCAPSKEAIGYQPVVDFHDAASQSLCMRKRAIRSDNQYKQYPIHLLSLSSLKALQTLAPNYEVKENFDPRRFRGNIIVAGAEAYDEDSWRTVKFKNPKMQDDFTAFDVSSRTVRCKLPNVDPDTGVRHKSEPDSTLRKHREIDEGAPKMGCLGMQLCPTFPDPDNILQPGSYVEVGMEAEVLERGSHFYIKQSLT